VEHETAEERATGLAYYALSGEALREADQPQRR